MNTQENIHYDRVAAAIDYIRLNFKQQPGLQEIAAAVHLSASHFQRIFTEWAGVSPKRFLQYTSIEYAKSILHQNKEISLFETALQAGLSGSGRLHDMFVNIEGMTPGEYKKGGEGLPIYYSFADSPFGPLIVASTNKGICYMAFESDKDIAVAKLKTAFPGAFFELQPTPLHQRALGVFQYPRKELPEIKLHLQGSQFQLKVWEALLKIPMGALSSYGDLAAQLHAPLAARAVGTAIGKNPVAFLIPCHRVIQSSGAIGGYMWGSTRKAAIIAWEGVQTAAI